MSCWLSSGHHHLFRGLGGSAFLVFLLRFSSHEQAIIGETEDVTAGGETGEAPRWRESWGNSQGYIHCIP